MSAMLYSTLMLCGKYSIDDLKNFRQWGSCTPGHPELDVKHGIENTSGPLGQGHVNAVGAAIAERFLAARFGEKISHKTFAYISDGGVEEEISQGAGRLAGYLGLGNLIMFYDSNDVQLSTLTDEVTNEDTAMKYEAWQWHVQTIKGNDPEAIRQALKNAVAETGRPSLIIGKTIMGYGAVDEKGNKMEGLTETHGQPLSKAGVSFPMTVKNLGGDPEHPFNIFPEVSEHYKKVLDKNRQYSQKRRQELQEWEKTEPGLSAKWHEYLSGKSPAIDYSSIPLKANAATRNASKLVLEYFAKHIGNMIVMSADLSNSDKTDGFLNASKALHKNDFSGAFLQIGVSELTMAALASGIALHGGVFAACATFFAFSDFMKPAIRLAALMELPVKYIWTHDSFRVGEDGPTHQPVEQEAQIRLLEQLKNHSGQNSMLVLRPANSAETVIAWKMAMENISSPSGLILSRQNIKDLPCPAGSTAMEMAMKADKGAYLALKMAEKPDLVMIANGSEVSTLCDAAIILEKDHGIKANVVSAISEGLFRKQDAAYQQSIIPDDVPHYGLTAGLAVTLRGLVGQNGFIGSMGHFGESAPAEVLDEKFGFTPEHVKNEVLEFMLEKS